jgi:hypothetical protein
LHTESRFKILDALCLGLAAAVGEQDERDIVVVQELEDLGSAGDRFGDVKQDTVDAARVLATYSFCPSRPPQS